MGCRAIITGSNRGTGLAIAKRLHAEQMKIASLNRTIAGPSWLGPIVCDLTSAEQIRRGCLRALDELGGVDLCVINAAVRIFKPIDAMSDLEWDQALAVNLSAGFRIVRSLLQALRDSGGTVIFIGSHAGSYYFEGGCSYCASKAALKALVEVLILETRSYGIRTTLLSPGAIRNREDDRSKEKIDPADIATAVWNVFTAGPSMLVGEIEMRPRRARQPPITGIDRLQSI